MESSICTVYIIQTFTGLQIVQFWSADYASYLHLRLMASVDIGGL